MAITHHTHHTQHRDQGILVDLGEPSEAATFDDLHDRWGATSRMRLGLSRQQWHHPATRDLVDAIAGGDLLEPALQRLGEARAGAGLSLDELLADLGVLAELVPAGAPAPADTGIARVDTLRAASVAGTAWAEAFYAEIVAPGCTDPITGLATGAFLEARLSQRYHQCAANGRKAEREQVLVVLQVQCLDRSPFACVARRIDAAGRLRTAFPDGDTVALLEPTDAMVVLTDSGPALANDVAALKAMCPEDAVWVEPLPAIADEAVALVRELATIPRGFTIAPDGAFRHP